MKNLSYCNTDIEIILYNSLKIYSVLNLAQMKLVSPLFTVYTYCYFVHVCSLSRGETMLTWSHLSTNWLQERCLHTNMEWAVRHLTLEMIVDLRRLTAFFKPENKVGQEAAPPFASISLLWLCVILDYSEVR